MADNKPSSQSTEDKLNDAFKGLPQLPDGGRKALVQWLPVISLVVGILMLLSAWEIWRWAHVANSLADYTNALCNAYGASCGISSRLTMWVWIDLAALVAVAVLYLLAYPGLKAHEKQGWQYLYYAVWVGVIQSVIGLFNTYDGASHLIGGLIGAAIGFYLLFQIRPFYTGSVKRK